MTMKRLLPVLLVMTGCTQPVYDTCTFEMTYTQSFSQKEITTCIDGKPEPLPNLKMRKDMKWPTL